MVLNTITDYGMRNERRYVCSVTSFGEQKILLQSNVNVLKNFNILQMKHKFIIKLFQKY